MNSIGIDPGLDGAFVWLSPSRVEKLVMPTIASKTAAGKNRREYDEQAIRAWLVDRMREGPAHAFLERQQAMPSQGLSSTFQTGVGYGVLRGLLSGLQIPWSVVSAQSWQKVMLAGLARSAGPKASAGLASVVCKRLWPTEEWRASERSKIAHDGLCDAALIAEYGRRKEGLA